MNTQEKIELLAHWERVCLQQVEGLKWHTQAKAPNTWEAVQGSFGATGEIVVWNGGSEKTIFSSPVANFAFRAWHDSCHLAKGLDFSLRGEERVCEEQTRRVWEVVRDRKWRRGFARLLEVEIVGQAGEFFRTGEFVGDQRAFAWGLL